MPPLVGHTVAVTGDRRSDELAAHLRGMGAGVLLGPVIRTRPLIADDRELRAVTVGGR
jgi:uroporphyrinogen-III synthase